MLRLSRLLLPALVTIFIFAWSSTNVNAAKILGLFAHPSESHFAMMRTVMTELARREHKVTIYSSHRLMERVENLYENVIEPEFPFWNKLQKISGAKNGLFELSRLSADDLQASLAEVGAEAVSYFLSNSNVKKLLQLSTEVFDYDVIIVDLFYTEALMALGHLHHKPTIAIVNSNFEDYLLHVQESMLPVACSPIDFDTYINSIGFWQRYENIRQCMARRKLFAKYNMAAQEKIVKQFFAHLSDKLPTVQEMLSNVAVLLLNNHIPLATPRPMLPNMISAGGLHIPPPRELPWNIRRFLEEARHGVIYMHLGNEQLCSALPTETKNMLLSVFAKRKQRWLWTCHDADQMKSMPEHVMIQHLVPQTDILAHPHIKAFVTSGELLSVQEGIVRHVPLIGLPRFRQEVYNMHLVEQLEVGIQLFQSNYTDTALMSALDLVTQNSEYATTIRRVSAAFRDRPLGALETCMYWVDYTLRHNGSVQLRTRGVDIPFHHLHLYDLFVLYFTVGVCIISLLVGIYFIMSFMQNRQGPKKDD